MIGQETLAYGSNMEVIDRIRETSRIKLTSTMQTTTLNRIACLLAKGSGKEWVARVLSQVQDVPLEGPLPAGALMKVKETKNE